MPTFYNIPFYVPYDSFVSFITGLLTNVVIDSNFLYLTWFLFNAFYLIFWLVFILKLVKYMYRIVWGLFF